MTRKCLLTLLLAACIGTAWAQEKTPNAWRQMAIDDLEFIRDTLQAQHPGPLNTDQPEFNTWLHDGFEQAMGDLDRVRSYGGYRGLVYRYIAGFRDGHLGINLHLHYRVGKWPGFMVVWRGEAFEVYHVEPQLDAPAVGDRLLSCDGMDTDTLWQTRVMPFLGKGIPADRYRRGPELLINHANPLQNDPESCRFARGDETFEVSLNWTWPDEGYMDRFRIPATTGQRNPLEIRELPDGSPWFSIPTFGPSGDQEVLMKSLMEGLAQYRDRDTFVVDVRGNGGGSSYWAEAFVRGLYGDAFWEALPSNDEGYAVHRVSPENLAHFENLLPQLAGSSGEDSTFYRYFAALVEGMRAALADGQGLYEHHFEDEEDGTTEQTGPATPAFNGRLVFLTDSACGSACLDFADVVLQLPNHVHVGHPTSADTIYMEVRGLGLPSLNGRISFATKFYRNRLRANNEYYLPSALWTGDISDTAGLEKWITGMR